MVLTLLDQLYVLDDDAKQQLVDGLCFFIDDFCRTGGSLSRVTKEALMTAEVLAPLQSIYSDGVVEQLVRYLLCAFFKKNEGSFLFLFRFHEV